MGLRRICTQHFRDTLLSYFPELKTRYEFIRHMRRLIYATDQGNIPISQKHIAFDFNVMADYFNHRFAAIDYIELFTNTVCHYEYSQWSFKDGKCRYAKVIFEPEVLKLIEDEKAGLFDDISPRVLIETGNLVTKNTRTSLRKEDMEFAFMTNKYRENHPLPIKWLSYLNELPYHQYTRVAKHIPEALNSIEDKDIYGNYIINPLAHREQRDILFCIDEQPQPFYTRSVKGNTVRLFEINKGLQSIHSYLRKILTQDLVEIDIQNAHLAIVAAFWGIPEIQEYLTKGESIWATLIPAMDFPYPNPRIKAALKEFFYGLIYGMGKKKLRKGMIDAFGEEAYLRFIKHPLIKALIIARNKRIAYISNKKEHFTPLGFKTRPYQRKDSKGEFESNVSTILSQEANEFEMMLLEPILDLAIASKSFTIVLYQFDGLTLHFKDKNRKDSFLLRMKKLIEARAKELGIITTLTW